MVEPRISTGDCGSIPSRVIPKKKIDNLSTQLGTKLESEIYKTWGCATLIM